MKACAIHLIEDLNKMVQIDKAENLFESGNWKVGPGVANQLIGGRIYLHKFQKEASFFGGEILGWRVHPTETQRIVFKFKSLPECKNVKTTKEGWGREKKIDRK